VVNETSWRCDQDIDTAGQRLALCARRDTAEDRCYLEPEVAAVNPEALTYLGSEFAGRCKDEHAAAVAWRGAAILGEAMENGQRERRSLAGAGLRDAKQIQTFHNQRNGLGLDWCWYCVVHLSQRIEKWLGEAE
jgi:hypothetical protein